MAWTLIPDPLTRLKVLLDSSTPIVAIESVEEVRAVRLVRAACAALNLAAFEWTIASGLVRCGGGVGELMPEGRGSTSPYGTEAQQALVNSKAIYNSQEPAQMLSNLEGISIGAAFILKDLHRHMDEAVVVRRLRDVGQKFSENRRTIILTSPKIEIPPELRGLVEFLELPLPDRRRLRQIIDEVVVRISKDHTLQRKLDSKGFDAVVESLRGLTEEESERALSQALVTRYALCPEIASDVLETKKSLLRRSEMLEFVEAGEAFSSVGGMDRLKQWLAQRRGSWEDSARDFGLEPPHGVIILGVQGCGKSLCARAVAGEWNLPLVKFDTAAVYDKYIGETEKRIRKVFDVAEGLAPCVLWIDELEKIFAGSGPDSASADAGVSSRLLASFLSWMQDRKAPVFVAATCNNVSALPPELIRKGRFDELFFVDLPSQAERKQIFSIQLARRKRNPAEFDLDRVDAAAKGYSGAEINAAVQTALYAAFSGKIPLSTQLLLDALSQTVPLSTTRAEEVDTLRQWARTRAVPASAVAKGL
ncbi:MAG TPA: AAA family ATPase [Candidatus Acidoferrum sp.]|jgi:SpoVK/Ycf46/Vps4 family AAA+-type ATPase|nr:AAA family ATPase [Candidatus Acidoferrum sp.]